MVTLADSYKKYQAYNKFICIFKNIMLPPILASYPPQNRVALREMSGTKVTKRRFFF